MTAVADTAHARPAALVWLVRLALVAGMVGVAWMVATVGPRQVVTTIVDIGPWFAVLLGIELVMAVIDAAALRVQLAPHARVPFGLVAATRIQLAGRAINMVTPLGSLGEVSKFGALAAYAPPTQVASALLVCTLTTTFVTIALIAVGAPLAVHLLDLPAPWPRASLVAGAALLLVGVGLAVLLARGLLSRLVDAARGARLLTVERAARWRGPAIEIEAQLRAVETRGARRRAMVLVVTSRVVGWSSSWVALAATGTYATPDQWAALITVGALVSLLASPIPLGIGVADGGTAVLYGALGLGAGRGVSIALARRMVTVAYAALGVVLALTDRRAMRR